MAKKNTDTVHAMLTPGEFVIKKSSAQKIGYDKLERANKTGELSHMNKGGKVKIKKKEAKMPQGKDTYGSQVGRPPKKAKAYAKGGEVKGKKKKTLMGWLQRVVPGGESGYEEVKAKPKKKRLSAKERAQQTKSSEVYKKAQAKTDKDLSWHRARTAAKKEGENLSSLIKSRDKSKKEGKTKDTASAQAKINKAYGKKARKETKADVSWKKATAASKESGALSLSALIKQRDKWKAEAKKGVSGASRAAKLAQNRINEYYGSTKRHDVDEKVQKKQFGGKISEPKIRTGMRPPVPGRVRGYSKGGKVTSEGYPVHGATDKYKVGE